MQILESSLPSEPPQSEPALTVFSVEIAVSAEGSVCLQPLSAVGCKMHEEMPAGRAAKNSPRSRRALARAPLISRSGLQLI